MRGGREGVGREAVAASITLDTPSTAASVFSSVATAAPPLPAAPAAASQPPTSGAAAAVRGSEARKRTGRAAWPTAAPHSSRRGTAMKWAPKVRARARAPVRAGRACCVLCGAERMKEEGEGRVESEQGKPGPRFACSLASYLRLGHASPLSQASFQPKRREEGHGGGGWSSAQEKRALAPRLPALGFVKKEKQANSPHPAVRGCTVPVLLHGTRSTQPHDAPSILSATPPGGLLLNRLSRAPPSLLAADGRHPCPPTAPAPPPHGASPAHYPAANGGAVPGAARPGR